MTPTPRQMTAATLDKFDAYTRSDPVTQWNNTSTLRWFTKLRNHLAWVQQGFATVAARPGLETTGRQCECGAPILLDRKARMEVCLLGCAGRAVECDGGTLQAVAAALNYQGPEEGLPEHARTLQDLLTALDAQVSHLSILAGPGEVKSAVGRIREGLERRVQLEAKLAAFVDRTTAALGRLSESLERQDLGPLQGAAAALGCEPQALRELTADVLPSHDDASPAPPGLSALAMEYLEKMERAQLALIERESARAARIARAMDDGLEKAALLCMERCKNAVTGALLARLIREAKTHNTELSALERVREDLDEARRTQDALTNVLQPPEDTSLLAWARVLTSGWTALQEVCKLVGHEGPVEATPITVRSALARARTAV